MYYILYGFLWLLSLLPLRLLYVLSDLCYGLIFYVFKYRRKVTLDNLRRAFPEKTEAERIKIAKKFYHNLVDTFVETIKMITASTKYLEKRFSCDWGILNQFYPTGRKMQIHLGHNFNWEWGNSLLAKNSPYKLLVVYMPIANKAMERLFLKLRTRTGSILIPATDMKNNFAPYRNTQYMMGLAADQNPGHPMNAWWFKFFGHPTPFVKGPARSAINNDTVVIFAFIHKKKRGHYEAVASVAEENPTTTTPEELTRKFVYYLEDVIRTYPDMWLWSHRRWKWEWKPEYGEVLE